MLGPGQARYPPLQSHPPHVECRCRARHQAPLDLGRTEGCRSPEVQDEQTQVSSSNSKVHTRAIVIQPTIALLLHIKSGCRAGCRIGRTGRGSITLRRSGVTCRFAR